MSIRKREGSPFWWYDFTIAGSRFRGSTGETDKRRARDAEADQRELARRSAISRGDWKLVEVLATYWDEHGKNARSSATIFHQLGMLRSGLGRDTRLSNLTNAMLMDYRARRRGHGLQPHSVNREIVLLRAATAWCNKIHGQPMPNLAWRELKSPEPPGRTRFLSREQYESVMQSAHPDLRPIILCAVTTGLRRGNILALDWSEVNLAAGWITVTVKGGKRHSARITKPLKAELARTPPAGRAGKVFVVTGFRKRWLAAVEQAGLTDFRFHDLRHTFASWARAAGADIADICEALGHSNISVTMRYAHIRPDEHITAFDRVAEGFTAQSVAQRRKK